MDPIDYNNKGQEGNGTEPGRAYDNETAGNDGAIRYDGFQTPLWYIKSRNAINYVLGILEMLLVFRFVFKLLGANPGSGFVDFLYSITGIFVSPFSGIFSSYVTTGLAARSVFEPATIIAMIVYAAAARGLVNLFKLKAVRDGN